MADVLGGLTLVLLGDWATTLTLVFGGCCSNALTLEQLTSQYPQAGSLITFAQFLLITLSGLRKFVQWTPYPHLKPRRIPILPYIIQVALHYAVSYLNNAAFAYRIPMTVHIIFRSGGLVISMIMGWLIQRKRYARAQIVSVILVTFGVILTTLSASKTRTKSLSTQGSEASFDIQQTYVYVTGIGILTLALVLSGLLGMAQDKTYATYIRTGTSSTKKPKKDLKQQATVVAEPWQESMFYLHFLSMPLFAFSRKDLFAQAAALSTSPTYQFVLPTPLQTPMFANLSFAVLSKQDHVTDSSPFSFTLPIPSAFVPLILNTLTQLVCVSGVHRLTSRVSSLTVTLVLVVRKAVSLLISVVIFGSGISEGNRTMLWAGAASVFLGTMMYSVASSGSTSTKKKKD